MEKSDNSHKLALDVSHSYAGYMKINTSNSSSDLDDEVDGLQKLMDELYTTLLTVQESGGELLETRLTGFVKKASELEDIYQQIDVIYEAVSRTSSNLQQLELAADNIEKQIDQNPLKKMWGFFKSQSDRAPQPVLIPAVFKTEEILIAPPPHNNT